MGSRRLLRAFIADMTHYPLSSRPGRPDDLLTSVCRLLTTTQQVVSESSALRLNCDDIGADGADTLNSAIRSRFDRAAHCNTTYISSDSAEQTTLVNG